ncbi:hypothetical protein N9S53_00540 [Candidatus Pelagibacter sp.]|nr:hypothetical protein [Candidatus Pelagibacter sp.]
MELLNQLIFTFYNLLNNYNSKTKASSEKIENYLEFSLTFFQNNFFLIFIFFILLIVLIYLNLFKHEKYHSIFLVNIFIFLIILILFPLNIPFVDVYNELNLLFSSKYSDYLFSTNHSGGFLFIFFRFLHLLIFKFFNLNYNVIIFINFLIFFLASILIINYLKKYNLKNYIFVFILLFFNGKWFVHFYEPVNIVWTINFIIILFFLFCKDIKDDFLKNLSLIIIFLFSIINFKAGIILFVYSIIYGFLIKDKIRNKFIFIFVPFLFYLLLNHFVMSTMYEPLNIKNIYYDYLNNKNYIYFINNFFAAHTLILTPYIFPIKYFAIFFVLFQYFFILKILFFKNESFLKSIKDFIIENPLILIGIIGCFLINLSREDYNQSRYVTFSLMFQMGFLIYFFKNLPLFLEKIFLKKRILLLIFLPLYFINLFLPNQGLLFAFGKNYIFEDIKNCLVNSKNNNDVCLKKMFHLTFYDLDEKKFHEYRESIYKIRNQKLTIFNEIK